MERSNYSLDAVFDGQNALDYLENENYDGVILDVMMPKMGEFTISKHLHEAGNLVPVLLLTAQSEIDDKVFGLDLGANDYRPGPFTPGSCRHDAKPGGTGRRPAAHGQRDVRPHWNSPRLPAVSGCEQSIPMELLMSNLHRLIAAERFLEKI